MMSSILCGQLVIRVSTSADDDDRHQDYGQDGDYKHVDEKNADFERMILKQNGKH